MGKMYASYWRIFFLVNLLAIASVAGLARAGVLQHKKVFLYEARRCDKPPKIDGMLDDECWKDLPKMTNFRTGLYSSGKPDVKHELAGRQTVAKICYDEKNLYIGIELQDPHPERVVAMVKSYDGPIWNDDSVEIYIEPGYSRKCYYKFCTNSINTRNDSCWRQQYESFVVDEKWGSKAQWYSKSSMGKDAWYLEVVIHFADLDGASVPSRGELWSFQIVRFCRTLIEGASSNLYDKRTFEYSSWAPGGNFKEPDKFGFLYFSNNFSEIEKLITEKLSVVMGTQLLRFHGMEGEFLYTDYDHAVAESVDQVKNIITELKALFREQSENLDKDLLQRFEERIMLLESDANRFLEAPNKVTFASDARRLIDHANTIITEIREAVLWQKIKKVPMKRK